MNCFRIAVLIGLFQCIAVQAQYVKIGEGNNLGSTAGPFVTNGTANTAYSRYAYIYSKAVLGNLKHGDTLRSVEFRRSAGFGLNSSTSLKIYFHNTSATDFGTGKLYWPTRVAAAKLVYFKTPQSDVGVKDDFYRFSFSTPYVFDSTKGENLEIYIEYAQTSVQQAIINWYYDSRFAITGYAQNQVKYSIGSVLQDSLPNTTDFHPMMILNYPRFDNDLEIIKLYTLGKLPIPLGNPDSVQVLIRNVGKKNQAASKVFMRISGANQLLDSTLISIDAGAQEYKHLKSMYPSKTGMDSLTAFVMDKNPVNNAALMLRLNNANVYSYKDPAQAAGPGGIGFNTSTGDFVAKFLSNKPKSINQVSVTFGSGGSPFRVGIWDKTGSGVPGTLLYQSDSLISVGGTYILDLKTPVSVNGSFFVGVRQLSSNNVAFGYQDENPARPGTFFYTVPLGNTTWTDFYPDAPYKFLIEPRLQADTDLTVLQIVAPRDSFDMYTMDTIAPKVKVGNVGAKDMGDSFSITAKIFLNGSLQYSKTIRDTLSSGNNRIYTFPKTFKPKQIGEYEIIAYVRHLNDQVTDNDSQRLKFYIGIKKDVLFQDVYDPSEGQAYNYLKDTLVPVGTVKNAGYDNTPLFAARCVIRNKTKVIYNRSITLKLLKFESRILNFPAYPCTDTGKWEVLFITEMATDASKSNDTVRRTIYIRKYFDLLIDSVVRPRKDVFYTRNQAFKPAVIVFNDGILPAFDAKLVCRIKTAYSNQTYLDTVLFNCQAGESTLVECKNFIPKKEGIYSITFKSLFASDYVTTNDSIGYDFNVGFPYDYAALKILAPLPTDTLVSGNGPVTPQIQVMNKGFVKNSDLVPVVFQIWSGNILIYQDIKSLNLDTNQSYVIPMANFFPLAGGHHRIVAYTNYVSDVRKQNDTVLGSFYVSIARDAYVLSIDSPDLKLYTAGESKIRIAATIGNHGKLRMNGVKVTARIFKNGVELFSTQVTDSLAGGEIKKMLFSPAFVPMDSGRYRLQLYTFHVDDQYIYNDIQEYFFDVQKRGDAVPLSWIVPGTSGNIIIDGIPFYPDVQLKNTGTDSSMALNGKLYYYISDSITGAMYFADSTGFSNLGAGETRNVSSSKPFVFSNSGTYIFTAIVKSPGDIFKLNDTLVMSKIVQFNGNVSLANKNIRIYPNPVSDYLFIDHKPRFTAMVYDMGLREIQVNRSGNSLDVSSIPAGVYFIKIKDSYGEYGFTFIKE